MAESTELDKKVMAHLTQFSFGSILDGTMIALIAKYLQRVRSAIENVAPECVQIKTGTDIAAELLGFEINGIKRSDELYETRLLFETAFVLVFLLKSDYSSFTSSLVMKDLESFLEKYHEFQGCGLDDAELHALFTFRNVMVVALCAIPARNHKNHLLEIVTKIAEGRHVKYVTGGGQTKATSRRVLIYSREGNVVAKTHMKSHTRREIPEVSPLDVAKREKIKRHETIAKRERNSTLKARRRAGASESQAATLAVEEMLKFPQSNVEKTPESQPQPQHQTSIVSDDDGDADEEEDFFSSDLDASACDFTPTFPPAPQQSLGWEGEALTMDALAQLQRERERQDAERGSPRIPSTSQYSGFDDPVFLEPWLRLDDPSLWEGGCGFEVAPGDASLPNLALKVPGVNLGAPSAGMGFSLGTESGCGGGSARLEADGLMDSRSPSFSCSSLQGSPRCYLEMFEPFYSTSKSGAEMDSDAEPLLPFGTVDSSFSSRGFCG